MKKLITVLLILISTIGFAQDQNDLKSILSLETGFLGVWLGYEQPISNKFLVKAEYGQEFGLYAQTVEGSGFFSTGTLSLETRYFYNREKRASLEKSIINNSGNYLAIELQRIPDILTTNEGDRILIITKSTTLIPKIGMKRNLGNLFTYEIAGGIGYAWNDNRENTLAIGLDLKIGLILF